METWKDMSEAAKEHLKKVAVLKICGAKDSDCKDLQIPEVVNHVLFNEDFYSNVALQKEIMASLHKLKAYKNACVVTQGIKLIFYKDEEAEEIKVMRALENAPGKEGIYVDPDNGYDFPMNDFYKLVKNCTSDFIIVPLSIFIQYANMGHVNMLFVNRKKKVIEHFEPHGRGFGGFADEEEAAQMGAFIDQEITRLKNDLVDVGWKFIPSVDICPNIQIQLVSEQRTTFLGTCFLWSLWFAMLRVANPNKSAEKQLEEMLKEFDYGSMQLFLEDYVQTLVSTINIELKKSGDSGAGDVVSARECKAKSCDTDVFANGKYIFSTNVQHFIAATPGVSTETEKHAAPRWWEWWRFFEGKAAEKGRKVAGPYASGALKQPTAAPTRRAIQSFSARRHSTRANSKCKTVTAVETNGFNARKNRTPKNSAKRPSKKQKSRPRKQTVAPHRRSQRYLEK